jgi:hypothetical protein
VKRFAFVLLPFLLAGCLKQQEAQLAKCKLETLSAGIDPTKGFEFGEGDERMTLCMRAAPRGPCLLERRVHHWF